MANKDARAAISRVFAAAGYSPHQIAGVLAHAERESGFDVAASGDKGASRGLFQWQGPRLKALKDFAAEQGASVRDPEVQAQFAVNELQTSEKGAGKALLNARDPREASIAMNRFERFSHNGGWKQTDRGESGERIKAAMRFGGEENVNVADAKTKPTPFDGAAQSVVDHMSKSAEGKSLQANYIDKTSPKPLEKEIAQAVAQNDQVASYVPKEPGKMVRGSGNNTPYVADDGDYHQQMDKDFGSVKHPNQNPKIENGPKELKEAPLDYGPDKYAPEPDQSNPLVQQTSMRVPRAEGQPRYKARQEERATRGADAAVSDMPPAPAKPAPKSTTEDDIIRQVIREEQLGNEVTNATGLTPNGQPITAEQAFNPTSVGKVAAPIAGGAIPLAVAASDQGDQRQPVPSVQELHDDPALKAVEAKVGAKPAAQDTPSWLKTALGDLSETLIPSVLGAVQENPSIAPAADNIAKSVVTQMAKRAVVQGSGGPQSNDGGYYQRLASEAGYAGDSQEMLRAVQQDQSGMLPPNSPMQSIPLPQPKPQDAPIDVSSYINGGGFEVG